MVTDRARCDGQDRLVEMVRSAAAAGVHLVQVRERDLEAKALFELVLRCVSAVEATHTRVLVNDRLDVALAAGAHGVHLPSHGVPAQRIRRIAPPGFLIGRSVHGVEEAKTVVRDGGLDFLVFGTVFTSGSKPGARPAGIDALRAVAATVPVPVLAIGGITAERIGTVISAGAAGIAAIGLFADAANEGPQRLQSLVAEASPRLTHPDAFPNMNLNGDG
jgi:thiamine-phosphate diphosphorylase